MNNNFNLLLCDFFNALGGISSDMRQEAWKFLFQYYGYNSTPR